MENRKKNKESESEREREGERESKIKCQERSFEVKKNQPVTMS